MNNDVDVIIENAEDVIFNEFCFVRNAKNEALEALDRFDEKAEQSEHTSIWVERRRTLLLRLDYWNAREDAVYSLCKKLGFDFWEFERKMHGEEND